MTADFNLDGILGLRPEAQLRRGTLGAGASCSMSVTFTPTAQGTRKSQVVISDNDPGSPETVLLSGTGQ